MTTRKIIYYWLVLLIPTLVISIAAFRLLKHEQERIIRQASVSAEEHARLLADNIRETVSSVENNLNAAMRTMPQKDIVRSLLGWQMKNPFVRNVFSWTPGQGLQYPHSDSSATAEESDFISRYNDFFSEKVSWNTAEPERTADVYSKNAPAQQQQRSQSSVYETVSKSRMSKRQQIMEIANVSPAAEIVPSGWIPWFSGNQLSILGWVQPHNNGPVYGMEIEFVILLSQLITLFPENESPGHGYALIDGSGNIVHQVGGEFSETKIVPSAVISLAPELPHWQLGVYTSPQLSATQTGGSFILLSSVLLVIFISAIIFGGSMLLWQAHSNLRDAQQKTSFVSNVSHELKTPLTSIRMYAELLHEGRVTDNEKRKHYLEVIASESQRLTRLVNNVLDFSRLEQGRKKYQMEEIIVSDLLYSFIKTNQLRINNSGMKLNLHISSSEVIVKADRDAIEQALLNLVDNAVKYAHSGETIDISLETRDGLCLINIMDRGRGIPQSHATRIFDKFHRVDDSLTAEQSGSGLGLSIARNLLRGMGGDLVFFPRDGGGSSFSITLPFWNNNAGRQA